MTYEKGNEPAARSFNCEITSSQHKTPKKQFHPSSFILHLFPPVLDPDIASRFLNFALDDELGMEPDAGHGVGDKVGNYKLEELLGEGGFGAVWRASQVEPIQREVALKIVRGGNHLK